MAASITLAGESLIAQKQAAGQILTVARFVLANVPGLDVNGPVNRAGPKPPAAQVVYTAPVTQNGYVNPNQVVYSLMMGTNIGDFDFNWIGLETSENVLLSVAYVPLQQKRKNILPGQTGNNVTRNFLVVFDGAQQLTAVTIDASTWQFDYTARMKGIDERERLSNRDIFGRACFFGTALQLTKVGSTYQLKPGLAYVEGIRLEPTAVTPVTAPSVPNKAWLDVVLQREQSDVVGTFQVVFGTGKVDYTDSVGAQHYLVPLADLVSTTSITDQRPIEQINGELVRHFAARDGDYPYLRARGTTKDDVGLGNLPNAKSDDPATDSSEILATTKALRAAQAAVVAPMVGQVAAFALAVPPAGWLKANGAAISRTVYADLFTAIGVRFGAGDGSTTFNLPDARGEFIRGWDDGRGIDPSRTLGTVQASQNASHTHTATTSASGAHNHTATAAGAGSHSHTGTAASAGAHTHTVSGTANSSGSHNHGINVYSVDTTGGFVADSNGGGSVKTASTLMDGAHTHTVSGTAASAGAHTHTVNTVAAGDHTHGVTVAAAAAHTHDVTVEANGGTEARSRNLALLYCIKY
ncbi:phage tail protein [Pseudomonas qingdaonensis]|uniref:phage tail-collar fiber domain-containing protein n=1 Tax=Pseudomonas qingdaonensis TaxID=2056231 RepID=UPI000C286C62|nr:phage tail protein [Pseudomonas qingdaonensis]